MGHSRRQLIMASGAALCVSPWSVRAEQAPYPTRPVRVIVGYGPGSAADVSMRILGEGLTRIWGQPVNIDNRPGASGIIAMQELLRARPDGYDFIFGDIGNLGINPSYFRNLPYSAERDLVPVVDVFSVPFVAFVSRQSPYKTLAELIAAAKQSPGKLTYASTGSGGPMFAGMEALNLKAGMKLLQVPFKDMGPLLTSVATGEVDVMVTSMATARPIMDRLRPLAVEATRRMPEYPDLPTTEEAAGLTGFEVTAWAALVAQKGTPQSIVDKVRLDAIQAMKTPEMRDKAAQLGLTLSKGMTGEALGTFIRAETEKYREVVEATGLRGD